MEKSNEKKFSKCLFELLTSFREKNFLFVEPGGNCGDYLIYKGAYKLAASAGIDLKTVTHEKFMNGDYSPVDVVYIHGSGGFVPWWSGTPVIELKKALSEQTGTIIVGPSTFAVDFDFLLENIINPLNESKNKNVYIFTREMTSYLLLKGLLPANVQLLIDHDTALNLELSDLVLSPVTKTFVGYFIRDDKEGEPSAPGVNAFFLDPGSYATDFDQWVQLHASAKKIVTNRLHSSILGSILGKEVVLLPNSFHKNRSVWEFSLKKRSVVWKESILCNGITGKILSYVFVGKFLSSYKVGKIIRKIKYGI